jgi:hypothetical protein
MSQVSPSRRRMFELVTLAAFAVVLGIIIASPYGAPKTLVSSGQYVLTSE